MPLRLETSTMVNAELLFGSMKIERTAGYLAGDVNEALLIAGRAEVCRRERFYPNKNGLLLRFWIISAGVWKKASCQQTTSLVSLSRWSSG